MKWESSQHHQGLTVAHVDELALPDNAVAIKLRAEKVVSGSTGISLCNSTFLRAKLDAIGGSYLCLIVPGTIGPDLRNMLQSARPGLLAACEQGRLTLSDPAIRKTLVKQVVLIKDDTSILNIEVSGIETWNIFLTADPPSFRGCLRATEANAKKLHRSSASLPSQVLTSADPEEKKKKLNAEPRRCGNVGI